MNADMIQIVIFAVVTVLLLVRLKSVLGTKTGEENTKTAMRVVPDSERPSSEANAPDEAPAAFKPVRTDLTDEELHKYAASGSVQAETVRKIAKTDSDFDLEEFIEGAKSAYEMLLEAFEDGDKQTLKQYVSMDIYEGFSDAIDAREKQGHTVDSKFIGVYDAQIVQAEYLEDTKTADICVRFVAERTRAVRDRYGSVVEGDLTASQRMTDTWTFTRRLNSHDPNWILTETQ